MCCASSEWVGRMDEKGIGSLISLTPQQTKNPVS
jgi:hypothetical protein